MTSPESQQCLECGARLPVYWPRGLCAQCALDGALELTDAAIQQSEQKPLMILADPKPAAQHVADSPPPRFRDYELLEEIAHGGMGVVYRARQVSLDRIVAVKMILAGPLAGKEFVQRFRAEASAAAILQHPNIVAIHEVGVHEGRHFFSMDYVEGQNLKQRVGQQALPSAKAARYVAVIAEAIHYAHERGILHRDLKPANVLIDSATDQPRITDFGLAKRLDGELSLTMTGQILGSPNFMPPEQAGARCGKVGRSSDVYALGGILYYLLTARAPFQAESLEGVVTQVLNAEPVSPRLLNASIPRDLETITLKCLEKESSRRYQTAQELADELGRVLRHEPIRARPVTAPELLWRWCRRKPAVASALGFALAALLAGLTATSWQWRRAEQERTAAQHLLYVANMNLIQQAWAQNNVSRVRDLLEETALAPDRGFEWYYWQRQIHLGLRTLRGHLQAVTSVAFFPDGQRLVTGSFDRTVKVWEVPSGQVLLTLNGHTSYVRSVAVSPDGQKVVSGSDDGTARVWDSVERRELRALKGHTGPVWSVAFSPDGQRIVTSSEDQTAKVWDAASGQDLFTLKGHTNWIRSVAFSPDGRQIVTGSDDLTARVWDAATGRELFRLEGHTAPIWSVAFSPDGQRILTGSEDQTANLWEAASGRELLKLRGHTDWVRSVAFSPDGRRIVTGSSDQTARLWDAASGELLFTLKGHSDLVWSVAFSPDGQRIATGGWDKCIKLWDANSSERISLPGHNAEIRGIAFSPDDQWIATGRSDGTATLRRTFITHEPVLLNGHRDRIRAVAFSPDGRYVVTGSYDQTAKLWETATGRELLTFSGHDDWVLSAAFSPDGKQVVTGSKGKAKLWEVANGRELLTLGGYSAGVLAIAFSPNGRLIVGGSGFKSARVWDATSGDVAFTLDGHQQDVSAMAFSPDGQRILTGSADETAKLWDVKSTTILLTFRGHSEGINAVAFSPDGQRVVTGSDDKTAKVWETGTGRELLTLKGHSAAVLAVAFSKDGQRVFTASEDQTARIWQAAQPAQVSAWQEEEQLAAQRLAAEMREQEAEDER